MMAKHFLITRPNYDRETGYLFSFSKEIVGIVKNDKNIRLTELDGPNANRAKVEKGLCTSDNTLAFFNGHGDEETILGHNDEPILDKMNIGLSNGKIIYALACDSLSVLGKLSIRVKAKAYVGYGDRFMWIGDPSRSAAPDKDRNSIPFRKICHFLIHSLVNGISVGEVIERTKHEYIKLIKNYGTSEDNYGDAPAIGLALSWNLLHLGMEGDSKAVFV